MKVIIFIDFLCTTGKVKFSRDLGGSEWSL